MFCIGGGHWILVTDLANKNFLVCEKLKVCPFLIFCTMNSRLNAKIVSSGHSRRSYRRVKKRTEAETSDFTKRIRFSASTDTIPFCSALKSLFFYRFYGSRYLLHLQLALTKEKRINLACTAMDQLHDLGVHKTLMYKTKKTSML